MSVLYTFYHVSLSTIDNARLYSYGIYQQCDNSNIMGLRLLKRLPLLSTALLTIPLISVNRVMATLPNPDYKSASSIYEFTARDIKGEEVKLEKYRGHVCLIVNVASQCGLTANNYKQMNELFEEYGESKGLRILAFPCNQFNSQEPGNAEDIVCFASERKVKFDMFDKINVNGDNAHPLYKFLKHKQGGTLGSFIKWNFTKFIVDKNGIPVERHGPNVDPKDLVPHLEKYW